MLHDFEELHNEANKISALNNWLKGLNNWLENKVSQLEEETADLKTDFEHLEISLLKDPVKTAQFRKIK